MDHYLYDFTIVSVITVRQKSCKIDEVVMDVGSLAVVSSKSGCSYITCSIPVPQ